MGTEQRHELPSYLPRPLFAALRHLQGKTASMGDWAHSPTHANSSGRPVENAIFNAMRFMYRRPWNETGVSKRFEHHPVDGIWK